MSELVDFSTWLLTLVIRWHLYASHTRRRRWKLSTPQTLVNRSMARASFIRPFLLKATTTPGVAINAATGQTPLKTTYGLSFLPSAIAAKMTVNLPLSSWPVVRIEIVLSPLLETVVSPGISNHEGASSMFLMWESKWFLSIWSFCVLMMKLTTRGTRSACRLWLTVVLRRTDRLWRLKNFCNHPLLARNSPCPWFWASSSAFRWIALQVTRRLLVLSTG